MKKPRNLCGLRVRKLRYQLGLSQPALAERCQRFGWDITRDVIAKIESRSRWVADFELAGLAKALNVPITKFYPKQEEILKLLQRSRPQLD